MKKKKVRPLNGYQKWMKDTYRELIFYIIREKPGLNATEIIKTIPKMRNEWFNLKGHDAKTKELAHKFPKETPSRKTIYKHLKELLYLGRIEFVSGGYVATFKRIEQISPKFNKQVHKLLSEDIQDYWYTGHAGEVAACYISSDPQYSFRNYQDLLNVQVSKFQDSLFWFEDLLENSIISGNLSTNVYSKKRKKINSKILLEGLHKYFNESKLFTFTIAIKPPELLEFLNSKTGQALALDILEEKWDDIIKKAMRKRERIEYLKRKK
jgi:hypothetical protein